MPTTTRTYYLLAGLAALALLTWHWTRRKKTSAPSAATAATTTEPEAQIEKPAIVVRDYPSDDTTDTVEIPGTVSPDYGDEAPTIEQGTSYQSFAGSAPGDVSDDSLSRLAPKTIDYLNSETWAPNGEDSGLPLFEAYQRISSNPAYSAEQLADVRAQIATAIDRYTTLHIGG